MVRGFYLPFPPREGDRIRVWDEDNEGYHDFTLCNVCWDVGEGEFIEEIEDDDLVPKILDRTVVNEDLAALVGYYANLGFERKGWRAGVAL